MGEGFRVRRTVVKEIRGFRFEVFPARRNSEISEEKANDADASPFTLQLWVISEFLSKEFHENDCL